MAEYPTAGTAPEWMAEIERRLAALERAPRLTNASITDDAGVVRVMLGRMNEAGTDYGFEVRNDTGDTVYQAVNEGVAYPRLPMQILQSGLFVPVTSATFGPQWDLVCPYATANAVQVQTYVSADAATTGELRLTMNIGGSPVTATVAIPAASGNYYEFKWAPVGLAVATGPIVIGVEARRTSGAGNVNVYAPVQSYMTTAESIAATPTGV